MASMVCSCEYKKENIAYNQMLSVMHENTYSLLVALIHYGYEGMYLLTILGQYRWREYVH